MDWEKIIRSHLALIIVAVVVAFAAGIGTDDSTDRLSGDERSYFRVSEHIYENHSYGGGSKPLRWPPGTPVLFAASFWVNGSIDTDAARAAQLIIRLLIVVAVYAIAWLVSGSRPVSFVSALIAGTYVPLIRASTQLISEPLGALMLTLVALSLAMAITRRGWSWYVVAGALSGAATLVRAEYVFLPIFVAIFILIITLTQYGTRRSLAAMGSYLAAFLVVVGSWSLAAAPVEDKSFVLVTTGGSTSLFIGTYLDGDGTRFGAKRALYEEVVERYPRYRGVPPTWIPSTIVIDTAAERHPAMNRDDALFREARINLTHGVTERPIPYMYMLAKKVPRLWSKPFRGSQFSNSWPIRAQHLFILALALCGTVLMLMRNQTRRFGVLFALVVFYVTISHLPSVAIPRYNLPVMPIMAVPAAYLIVEAFRRAVQSKKTI